MKGEIQVINTDLIIEKFKKQISEIPGKESTLSITFQTDTINQVDLINFQINLMGIMSESDDLFFHDQNYLIHQEEYSIGELFVNHLNIDTNIIKGYIKQIEEIEILDRYAIIDLINDYNKSNYDVTFYYIEDLIKKIDYNRIDCKNIDSRYKNIIRNIIKIHPYFSVFIDGLLVDTEQCKIEKKEFFIRNFIDNIIETNVQLYNILDGIEHYRKIALESICANVTPEFPALSPMTRYYVFINHRTNDSRLTTTANTESVFQIYTPHKFLLNKNPTAEDIIKYYQDSNVIHSPMNGIDIYWNFETLKNNLLSLIQINKFMNICKLCGKFYYPKGNYQSDYCDNLYLDTMKTCQQFIAQQNRKAKVSQNAVLKEYEKAYKRNYARVTNKRMTNEDFRKWVDEAIIERDRLNSEYNGAPPDDVLIEFKKYLGNKLS